MKGYESIPLLIILICNLPKVKSIDFEIVKVGQDFHASCEDQDWHPKWFWNSKKPIDSGSHLSGMYDCKYPEI